MTGHRVGTRREWLAARLELLEAEKELTRRRRVVRERLGITPDEIGGGHLVALSRPKELADRLEAYPAEH